MADTTPAVTNPAAPGLATTEGKFTLAAQIAGFLLATFGAALTKWAQANPGNTWAGVSIALLGVAMVVCTHFGYTKGRAIVKNAMLQQGIDWAAPQLEALLEKSLAKYLQPAPDATAPATSSSSAALTAAPAVAPHTTVAPPYTVPSSPR